MKAITIKQPWASLICSGIKDIENRTWPTKFRGRVLVHASAAKIDSPFDLLTNEQYDSISQENRIITNNSLEYGAIIGSVEIVDCVINHTSIWAERSFECTHPLKCGSYKTDSCTPACVHHYEEKTIYNWVLANPIMFPEPIPAKGKLSFWEYPNILAAPEEENGELFCHCQIPVEEKIQVTGDSRFGYYCRYCGGRWYK